MMHGKVNHTFVLKTDSFKILTREHKASFVWISMNTYPQSKTFSVELFHTFRSKHSEYHIHL